MYYIRVTQFPNNKSPYLAQKNVVQLFAFKRDAQDKADEVTLFMQNCKIAGFCEVLRWS